MFYHFKLRLFNKFAINIFFQALEIKDYKVMINGRNIFDQKVKTDLKIYDNIHKVTTGQGDDYTTRCLLDYPYFKKYYNLIVIELSK